MEIVFFQTELGVAEDSLLWFNSDLRELVVQGTLVERPTPIGFWRYNSSREKKNGRWVGQELSRGTTPRLEILPSTS